MKVKLCGLKRTEDINYANVFHPDYTGFVFAESKRQITTDEAANLRKMLDKNIKLVGIFVNEEIEKVIEIAEKVSLDVIQLHGDEGNDYIIGLRNRLCDIEIWKAIRVTDEESILTAIELPVDKLVLDAFSPKAYGGLGKTADWSVISSVRDRINKPFFLAGGMNIDNIEEANKLLSPYGIDISSGIETENVKDSDKIKAIMQLIKQGSCD